MSREPDARAVCYWCGHMGSQQFDSVSDVYRCDNCQAEQCQRVRCDSCGKTCTRPEGHHYCSGVKHGQS